MVSLPALPRWYGRIEPVFDALSKVADERALPALFGLFDHDWPLRSSASFAIQKIVERRGPKTWPALVEATQSTQDVAEVALNHLMAGRHPQAFVLLERHAARHGLDESLLRRGAELADARLVSLVLPIEANLGYSYLSSAASALTMVLATAAHSIAETDLLGLAQLPDVAGADWQDPRTRPPGPGGLPNLGPPPQYSPGRGRDDEHWYVDFAPVRNAAASELLRRGLAVPPAPIGPRHASKT